MGEIQAKDYLRVIRGYSPEGAYLLGNKVNYRKKRAATDFVFGAPKSISLQALLMQDSQVRLAHWLAVQTAIAYAEKYVKSRWQQGDYGVDRRRVTLDTNKGKSKGNLAI